MKRSRIPHQTWTTAVLNGQLCADWNDLVKGSSSSTSHSSTALPSRSSSLSSQSTLANMEEMECNDMALSASLKRFKISTSPGELRLNKDVEQLVIEFKWYNPNYDINSQRNPSHLNLQQTSTSHPIFHSFTTNPLVSPDRSMSIERDQVDPLRLRICIPQFEFLLQIPRMYPHSPPMVYRVTHRNATNSANTIFRNSNASENLIKASSFCIPPPPSHTSSPTTHHNDFFRPNNRQIDPFPKIIISNKVPESHNSQPTHNMTLNSPHVVEYNDWTPISRLIDLISWLKNFPFQKSQSTIIQDSQQNTSIHEQQKSFPQCTGETSAQSKNLLFQDQHSTIFHEDMDLGTCMDTSIENNADMIINCENMNLGSLQSNHLTRAPRISSTSQSSKCQSGRKSYTPGGKVNNVLFQPNRFDMGFPKSFHSGNLYTTDSFVIVNDVNMEM